MSETNGTATRKPAARRTPAASTLSALDKLRAVARAHSDKTAGGLKRTDDTTTVTLAFKGVPKERTAEGWENLGASLGLTMSVAYPVGAMEANETYSVSADGGRDTVREAFGMADAMKEAEEAEENAAE